MKYKAKALKVYSFFIFSKKTNMAVSPYNVDNSARGQTRPVDSSTRSGQLDPWIFIQREENSYFLLVYLIFYHVYGTKVFLIRFFLNFKWSHELKSLDHVWTELATGRVVQESKTSRPADVPNNSCLPYDVPKWGHEVTSRLNWGTVSCSLTED